MVLDLTDGNALPAWTADQLANFRRGRDRERDILADLPHIGRNAPLPFEVVGHQERFELRDHKGRIAITGKKDASIRFEMTGARKFPVEVKSWSENVTGKIQQFEDLFLSPWTRSGAYQLLSYLYGFAEPLGFLVLDRHGLPMVLPVELEPNLDRVEDFLARAETALDHLEAGTLPGFYRDPEECRRCPMFGAICNPPLEYQAAQVLSDPELEADLNRREELLPGFREFESLDKSVKQKLRSIKTGLAGQFLIEGKEVTRRGYTVTEAKWWETRITKLGGNEKGSRSDQRVSGVQG
jgi:hypothetical protein